jgi:hypothetical protein
VEHEDEALVEIKTHEAYLGKDFSWYVRNDSSQEHEWNIEYAVTRKDDLLEFSVKDMNGTTCNVPIVVEITPHRKWNIPARRIRLISYISSFISLTACWKAFEYYVMTEKIKADLVQLNNYYQYEPLLHIQVLQLEPDTIDEKLCHQWNALKQALEGQGVRQIIRVEKLAALWNISYDQAINALLLLRSLGYEVRSEYTNNQIPSGHVLIPYPFPTFTPKSVQLRKTLFPPSFFEQKLCVAKDDGIISNGSLWEMEETSI